MKDHLLSNYVDKPTRKNNILDLFISNNSNLILNCDAIDTSLSDHRIIKLKTAYNIQSLPNKAKSPILPHSFRSLNFNKADFSQINNHLQNINWEELQSHCSLEEFPELFHLTVLQVCMLYTPIKNKREKMTNQFVKARNILRRRKRKVKAQVNAIKSVNPTAVKLIRLRAEL